MSDIDRSPTAAVQPHATANLEAALRYANSGYFVVPLHTVEAGGMCTCRRADCSRAGKHPLGWLCPHGAKDASRFPPQIQRWWAHRPAANIGIVTGPSGLVVLDVDPRNGGDESLAELVDRVGPLPSTLTAMTGGGGHHYVFADPCRRAAKRIMGRGLDVVAGNGLIVAAPSLHRSGRVYRWVDADQEVAPAPLWLEGES